MYKITKGLESDLEKIEKKWPGLLQGKGTDHIAESLIEGLHPPTKGAGHLPEVPSINDNSKWRR